MISLAIIIPYYRLTHLKQALLSIWAQTDARYVLYLFDDASPESPASVLQTFPDDFIRYRRFTQNLGGRSTARQWNRCVEATSEEWVWLFSDDDQMEPGCVDAFQQVLAGDMPGSDVWRFDTGVIDAAGTLLRLSPPNPPWENGRSVATARFNAHREFFVQNHIFHRTAFVREGGFYDLPCGFLSDDASFSRFGRQTGVRTIPGPRMLWRQSNSNLNAPSKTNADAKHRAFLKYLHYLESDPFSRGTPGRGSALFDAVHWFTKAVEHIGRPESALLRWWVIWQLSRRVPAHASRIVFALRRSWAVCSYRQGLDS